MMLVSHGLRLNVAVAAHDPKSAIQLGCRNSKVMSNSLMKVLWEARCDHRLTCGVFESGNKLQMNPESVTLCLLPDDQNDDIGQNIHSMLLKAFCLENGIFVIKVDSVSKRDKLLDVLQLEQDTDLNCLLIEYPASSMSDSEEILLEFCRQSYEDLPDPFIELEV